MTMKDSLLTFTAAYFEAARFTDFGGDAYIPADAEFSPSAKAKMGADCAMFWDGHGDAILEIEEAGHDFWLTRNRHGAGFWDGDWPDPLGDTLTEAAHSFGEQELYLGDDGLVYVFGAEDFQ